jgi:capsular polysaccharide biosynthesis protein/Mrp family chromosome partitioning ATPase
MPVETSRGGYWMRAITPLVRRWWWLLAVGTAASTLVGFFVASRVPPTYEAEARLLVGPLSGTRDTLRAAGEQTRTYAEVATAAPILQGAASRVGVSSGGGIKSKVSVTASDVTRLLTVRAKDQNAASAAAIANAVARELVRWATTHGTGAPEGRLTVVEEATPPAHSSGPSLLLIVPLAGIAGFLGALGLAALVDSLIGVVRTEGDLADAAPVSVFGTIDSRSFPSAKKRLVVDARPDSNAASAYRLLAAKIEMAGRNGLPRSLAVIEVSAGRSAGRMAANLALAFSRAGRRVVVVDGSDGRELLGISGHDGTPAFLRKARPVRAGDLTLDRFRMQGSTVVVVRPRPGAKTLDEKTASDAIRSLLTEADVVVVAASTGGGSPNSLVWSRAADATLVVADSGRTRRDEIPFALETLRIVKANVIGAVLARDNLF